MSVAGPPQGAKRPLGGQRRGVSRKRGGTSLSVAAPPKSAQLHAASGGNAAARAASVGAQQ